MKCKTLLVSLLLIVSTLSLAQQGIREEIGAANFELMGIYKFSVKYNLTILKGEGHEHPTAIDDDGIYQIFLYTSNYRAGVARHELAHVYFFEHLRRNGASPEEVPLWYHELIAEGFQNLNSSMARPGLRAGFYRFIAIDKKYPPQEEQGAFYGSVGSFASFLTSRLGYEGLIHTIEVFSRTGDMEVSFKETYGIDLSGLILRWRFLYLYRTLRF